MPRMDIHDSSTPGDLSMCMDLHDTFVAAGDEFFFKILGVDVVA